MQQLRQRLETEVQRNAELMGSNHALLLELDSAHGEVEGLQMQLSRLLSGGSRKRQRQSFEAAGAELTELQRQLMACQHENAELKHKLQEAEAAPQRVRLPCGGQRAPAAAAAAAGPGAGAAGGDCGGRRRWRRRCRHSHAACSGRGGGR